MAGATTLLATGAFAQETTVEEDLAQIMDGIYALHDKAEAGEPQAAFVIGSLYYNGIFIPADRQTAIDFLETAAEGGDPDGLYYLGLHHHHGVEKERDTDRAMELIQSAADAGHAAAGSFVEMAGE